MVVLVPVLESVRAIVLVYVSLCTTFARGVKVCACVCVYDYVYKEYVCKYLKVRMCVCECDSMYAGICLYVSICVYVYDYMNMYVRKDII